jgi:OH-DDVA oxygenase
MADIVLGIGTSHSPMLSLAPDQWDLRTDADRAESAHPYRGGTYTFDELNDVRDVGEFDPQNGLNVRQVRFARCQVGLDALADKLAAVKPDVLVVIGDDQKDWFLDDIQPAFTIYHGETVFGAGFGADDEKQTPPAFIPVRRTYRPPADTDYTIDHELARHIVDGVIADEFDVTSSVTPPSNDQGPIGIGHAFGFVNQRLLNNDPMPSVPVMINTYYPPNQPSAKRCYDFGVAIGRAIQSLPANKRVAIAASGGLSHFVVDEELDQRMMAAMKNRDVAAIFNEPAHSFLSGSSEIKNWLCAAGIMSLTDLAMDFIDYVPCYRSDVGTGTAMGFAVWD